VELDTSRLYRAWTMVQPTPITREADWNRNAVTGCVCIDTGEVFVKLGDSVRPAAILLARR
jgi:hypothetical protein